MGPVFGKRIKGLPYIVRPSAYVVVKNHLGLLATARTKRGWFLPGGGIDAPETPEEAAIRETREECGLVIQPTRLIGKALEIVHVPRRRACVGKDSFFYQAVVVELTEKSEADHELEWIEFGRANDLLSDASHRWAIQSAIHNPQSAIP
jgi:8-oxo-dGTP diphosphatase